MEKTNTRIYRVSCFYLEDNQNEVRLIKATSQAAAERFAFKDRVKAVRATQDQLVEALEDGIKVEEAGVSD